MTSTSMSGGEAPDSGSGRGAEPELRTLTVESGDGARVGVTVRRAPAADQPAPVVLMLPAMGVRATFYDRLAGAFARRGCHCMTADLRGLGTSSVRAGRKSDFSYRQLVELDVPALLRAAGAEFPGSEIYCAGHSLGGQVACLTAAGLEARDEDVPRPAGLVLFAACSVYYGAFTGVAKAGVFTVLHGARLSSRVLGWFPGNLVGFGGREARGLIADWWHQGTTGRYRVSGSELDYESLLGELEIRVLAISFTDDGYSPKTAVQHLLGKLGASRRTHLHLSPADLGAAEAGHFGWIRHSEALVERVMDWQRIKSK